mgnify:FL=1
MKNNEQAVFFMLWECEARNNPCNLNPCDFYDCRQEVSIEDNNIAEQLSSILPKEISSVIGEKLSDKGLQEIRLRVNKPLLVLCNNREYIYENTVVDILKIRHCMQLISQYSLYVHKEDIRNGFITVRGGHRVGIIGQAVLNDTGIEGQKNISFINIRVAHEVKGCADKVMDFVCRNLVIKNTLVISPPGCGKTTLLRDIIRQISDGERGVSANICVVDERSELGACFEGVPQKNLGMRTDVFDQACKPQGMLMLLRSMSPQIIAVDELGAKKDFEAVKEIMSCGVLCFATIHGFDLESIMKEKYVSQFIAPGMFERIIVLSKRYGVGTVENLIEL